MSAAASPRLVPRTVRTEARATTLLELVRAVGEVTDDEREVVATVLHMIRSGSVRLIGNFRDVPVDAFAAPDPRR